MMRWNEIDEADFLNQMKEANGRFVLGMGIVGLLILLAIGLLVA